MNPGLLFMCWSFSLLSAPTKSIKVNYSCVTAFWDNVTCELEISGCPKEECTFNLTFKSLLFSSEETTCPLTRLDQRYRCDCKITTDEFLHPYEGYNISLCNGSHCHHVTDNFIPYYNIQLTPPGPVEVLHTKQGVNVSWRSVYTNHTCIKEGLDYQVLLQELPNRENKILSAPSNHHFIVMSHPKPAATYCAKVRSIYSDKNLTTDWSKWSPTTCWETGAGEGQDGSALVTLARSVGSVVAVIILVAFLFYGMFPRMKMKHVCHTPSPEPFFRPLFQQHEGNLKEWLSPPGKFMLAYKTEEIVTADPVVVLPKTVIQEPDEVQELCFSPATPVGFPQCQLSYVGLPEIQESLPPLPVFCPGNMSYTKFPCAIWGSHVVKEKENEVLSQTHVIKTMSSDDEEDSGCNFDDISKSQECSPVSSPVDESPPVYNCRDYCILNKTAEGFAPVLVSRGGIQNVQSEFLQDASP